MRLCDALDGIRASTYLHHHAMVGTVRTVFGHFAKSRHPSSRVSHGADPRCVFEHLEIHVRCTWLVTVVLERVVRSRISARVSGATESELPLNRGAQHRPQVHHQLVGLEPQRRLLVGLAGEDWLGRANHTL